MISFSAPGTELARMFANARLFCANDSQHFPPDLILVRLSDSGVAAAGCDGYAVGWDQVGDPEDGRDFQIAEADAEAIEKLARSERRKEVMLELDGSILRVETSDDSQSVMAHAPDEKWSILDILFPETDAGELPTTVAFACDRLTRFGRVKTIKDAPIDIRIMPTFKAPIALFRIGPTFRGALTSIDRQISKGRLGEEPGVEDCFWTEVA